MVFLVLALMVMGASCRSAPTAPPQEENEVGEMTHLVTDLQPGTTYYWKVLAASAAAGFSSESIVFSFTTDEF
jgi:hypothetical protein